MNSSTDLVPLNLHQLNQVSVATHLVQCSVLDVDFLVPVTIDHGQHVSAHCDLAMNPVGGLTATKKWLAEQTRRGNL